MERQALRLLLLCISLISSTWGRAVPGMPKPGTFDLELAQTHGLQFFVGSVHHDWVLQREGGCLDVADRALRNRTNCLAVDVGMNDGFYTQLAAAYGCRVYSFELQLSCIGIARNATLKNNFGHLVNIFHSPVSKTNGEEILIPRGEDHVMRVCDGGFSVQHGMPRDKPIGHHAFHTVSLDAFIAPGAVIDFFKLDVEGHDVPALEGAENLFKEKRIRRAVIEVNWKFWPMGFEEGMEVYRRIMGYGYRVFCANEVVGNSDYAVVRTDLRFDEFKEFVRSASKCVDWEFFL